MRRYELLLLVVVLALLLAGCAGVLEPPRRCTYATVQRCDGPSGLGR